MRLRRTGMLCAGALAALALASPALGAQAPAGAGGFRVTVTELGSHGESATASDGRATRSLAASGCRELDVVKESRSFLFGSLVYRWHQTKRWCWSNGRITSVIVGSFATNVDPNWSYRGLAGSIGYFTGANQSGHYSFRQARMENCILKWGCVGSEYPWVKIWVRGDGGYSTQTGS